MDEFSKAQKLAASAPHNKCTFKAKEVPEFCRPGLYKPLVQDKIDYWKAKFDNIKELKATVPPQPYYSSMHERFQHYEKKKLEKLEAYKNKPKEEHKSRKSLSYGIDFKKYFNDQQRLFSTQLLERKAKINSEIKRNLKKSEPFKFTSELNPNRRKHNCFPAVVEGNKFKRPRLHRPILKRRTTRQPSSKIGTKTENLTNESKQVAFVYNPAKYLHHESLPRTLLERNILMTPEEAFNCKYLKDDQCNTINAIHTDQNQDVEKPRHLKILKNAKL